MPSTIITEQQLQAIAPAISALRTMVDSALRKNKAGYPCQVVSAQSLRDAVAAIDALDDEGGAA